MVLASETVKETISEYELPNIFAAARDAIRRK